MKIDFVIISNHLMLPFFILKHLIYIYLNNMINVRKYFIKMQTYNVIYFDHKCTRNFHINDIKSKMSIN